MRLPQYMRSELLGFGVAGDGQLGLRVTDTPFLATPEHIVGAPRGENGISIAQVACGHRHTVFLTEAGELWSVGANDKGQLGRGSVSEGSFSIYPVLMNKGIRVIEVSAGRDHTCAVTEDGRLFVWGDNSCGQLALPANVALQSQPKRLASLNEVVQVSCGALHTIALLEGANVFVWGEQYDGARFHSPVPVVSLVGIPIVCVATGGGHWISLSASGALFAWGANEHGQLGIDSTQRQNEPVLMKCVQDMKVIDVACGRDHTLLLTRDGRVFGCGADQMGQLGLGRRESTLTPRVIQELMGWHVTRIAAGRAHSVAVVGGRTYTFGLGSTGQLGHGHVRNQITPKCGLVYASVFVMKCFDTGMCFVWVIDGLDSVRSIFAGWDQTFLLRTTGFVNSISGPSNPRKLPKFLTWSNSKELLRDKLELIGQLESVFSSLSCINGSFLFSDDRRFSCGERNSGVNLDDAMELFHALAVSPDQKQYSELVRDSLDVSLFTDDGDSSRFHSPECLRVFIVLPWLEDFVKPTPLIVKSLHVRFCMRILRLKKEHLGVLQVWWQEMAVRHFKRVVTGIVAALECSIATGNRDTPLWTVLLRILRILNNVNITYNKIPLESFYVSNLAEKVDLQMDYSLWATTDRNNPSAPQFFWSEFPFIMNGIAKGELLNVEAKLQMHGAVSANVINVLGMNLLIGNPFLNLSIRRDHIIQDTMNLIDSTPREDLRKPLKVSFQGEEAEDHGGVKKEFFMILFEQLMTPEYGLFVENEESHLVWFSGIISEERSFKLVGTLCGLSVYNGVLAPFPFPIGLYKLLLGKPLSLDDLTEWSPTEGRSLQSLLDYEGDDVEDVFCLTFTITHTVFGAAVTEELCPGGLQIPVTNANRAKYVEEYIKARLERGHEGEVARQIAAFCAGFKLVVNSRIISFFQPRELMEMIVGNENYDWCKFKQKVQYKGEYHARHPTIIAFWDAFFELTLEERKAFLQFLCGSTRLPVQGMDALEAHIQPCAAHLLPVGHTCFNLLDLPNLPDKAELLRRLRISIQHPRGFSLV